MIKQDEMFEKHCNLLLEENGVIFAAVVGKNGKMLSGGQRQDRQLFDESKNEIMFMEQVLMSSMNKEFDTLLGKVGFTMTKREKVTIITFSVGSALFFVAVDANDSTDKITSKIQKIVEEFSMIA